MIIPFVEDQFDLGYDFGAVGGPEFSTQVIELASGAEQRNINWSQERGSWQIGQRIVNQAELGYIGAFFRARRGRAVGFRFKDWTDWQATDEALAPTGMPTLQLQKTYASGGASYVRTIQKPVAGTVSLKRAGAAFAGFTLDTTTGIVTLTADWSGNVSAITQANPGVMTLTGHGRTTGDVLYLDGIGGMTALNGQTVTITVIDANTFSIGLDTTAMSAYTAGGTAAQYVQPSETLTWSGEFDVPARFDVDKCQAQFEAYDTVSGDALFSLQSLPVVSIRV